MIQEGGKEGRSGVGKVAFPFFSNIWILEANHISFSFFVFVAENAFFLLFGLLFLGRKRCTYFRCILFFCTDMAVITENRDSASALTWLMHEGPRSSVNFSQYVQPQSPLGINMGGLGCVRSTSQSKLKQMDLHSPGHLPTSGSIIQLHTA